ncbi:thioredoxin family protein [Spirosoma sp. 209]|uniref:thioredoxin family protein n=1 Tax=Spirosoma sp. 209 TaxID=1955701 RepID=UPI00098D3B18|nr:thioredoxin family protein [Spirosoma sp. 209]
MRYALITLWVLFTLQGVNAQPKGYTLGDAVADFRLKNVDGRTVGLADYKSQKGLIVVFTSNHCPFSKAYDDRLVALDRKFSAQGYPVLAIMPNDPAAYEDDSFDNMKVRAREKGFSFAYVIDETQAVTRSFGATRTPQVFVLKNNKGQFTVEYIGTIDDSPQDGSQVQRRYADEAVSNLLAGRPVQSPLTKAIGCAVKWKN